MQFTWVRTSEMHIYDSWICFRTKNATSLKQMSRPQTLDSLISNLEMRMHWCWQLPPLVPSQLPLMPATCPSSSTTVVSTTPTSAALPSLTTVSLLSGMEITKARITGLSETGKQKIWDYLLLEIKAICWCKYERRILLIGNTSNICVRYNKCKGPVKKVN